MLIAALKRCSTRSAPPHPPLPPTLKRSPSKIKSNWCSGLAEWSANY